MQIFNDYWYIQVKQVKVLRRKCSVYSVSLMENYMYAWNKYILIMLFMGFLKTFYAWISTFFEAKLVYFQFYFHELLETFLCVYRQLTHIPTHTVSCKIHRNSTTELASGKRNCLYALGTREDTTHGLLILFLLSLSCSQEYPA